MKRLSTLAVVLFVVAGCGDSALRGLAVETCEDLEDSIVLTAGLIVERAISTAEGLGYSGPELGDAMREECPAIMLALESVANEPEERAQRESAMADRIEVTTDSCSSDGYGGTIRNNNTVTVDVTIEVEFFGEDGLRLANSLDIVRNLSPGQSARWNVSYFGSARELSQCRWDISSVRESR